MTQIEFYKELMMTDFEAAKKAYRIGVNEEIIKDCDTADEVLLKAFKWRETKEGFEYWNSIYEKLIKKEKI